MTSVHSAHTIDVDAVTQTILTLPMGGSYSEERREWGPTYVPACSVEGGQYATNTFRFIVRRQNGGLLGREFRFFTQVSFDRGQTWEDSDLGMSSDHDVFERCADPHTIEQHMALFRAILDVEVAELNTSTDSIRERSEYGITDEHLRSGTISEATIAELETESSGLKVAA